MIQSLVYYTSSFNANICVCINPMFTGRDAFWVHNIVSVSKMELSSYTGLTAMQLSLYSEHIFDQYLKDASEVQPLLHVAEFIFQKHFIKHDPDLPSLFVSLLVQRKGQQKSTKR